MKDLGFFCIIFSTIFMGRLTLDDLIHDIWGTNEAIRAAIFCFLAAGLVVFYLN